MRALPGEGGRGQLRGNLVADRRDLVDGRPKPLLSVFYVAQTLTSILPNVRRKQQGWKLTEVENVRFSPESGHSK
jgi:hypothetical protein